MRKIFLLLIVLIGASFPILAWDDAGHKISAYIAWQRMTPQARERAAKILLAAPEDADLSVFYLQDSRSAAAKQRELFMIASTWADIVRDRKFKERYEKYHQGNWHYADTFWSVTNGKIEYLKDMKAKKAAKPSRNFTILIKFCATLRNPTPKKRLRSPGFCISAATFTNRCTLRRASPNSNRKAIRAEIIFA
jgi:hypothetical protein